MLAWSGDSTMLEGVGQGPLLSDRLTKLVEIGLVVLAEPAGDAQPEPFGARHLPQQDERLDQVVQALLRTDAGEVADGERLDRLRAVLARRGRARFRPG